MDTLIKGCAHTAFDVADMEKTIQFYHDVLGFDKAFEINNPDNDEPWIVYIHAGGNQFIELFYNDKNSSQIKNKNIGFFPRLPGSNRHPGDC